MVVVVVVVVAVAVVVVAVVVVVVVVVVVAVVVVAVVVVVVVAARAGSWTRMRTALLNKRPETEQSEQFLLVISSPFGPLPRLPGAPRWAQCVELRETRLLSEQTRRTS